MRLEHLEELPPWEWPPGVKREVMAVLSDERADEAERVSAARLAGDITVVDDEVVEQLLTILDRGDFSDELRAVAALAVGPVLELANIDGFEPVEGMEELDDHVPISESTFRRIDVALRKLYMDGGVPKEVRRRILEASVRAPQDWHPDAIRAAYKSREREWRQTAVFAMRWVDGFEAEILESLESRDPAVRYEAVCAAGNWGIEAAWPHVTPLLDVPSVNKATLLAAIEAVASIRPKDAPGVLSELLDAEDEDVAEAALEAVSLIDELGEIDVDFDDAQ